jgi:O-antigen/teichoic acid export membrane protein
VTTEAPTGIAADDPLAAGEAGGKVIRGGSLRAATHVVGVLVGVVSAPLVVRHLGVVGYGRYLTVVSVIYIVTGLTEGGLANVAVRAYATSDRAGRRALVSNLAGLRIVLSILGGGAAIGFGVIAGYEEVVVGGLALGAIGYLLSALQGTFTVPLSAGLRLTALAGTDIARSLMTTALLLALVIAGSGLTGFYLVLPIVSGLTLALTAALVRREVPLLPAFQPDRWRRLLRETAVYAAATALGTVYFQIALVSMSVLDAGEQTGYFAIAFRIVDLANGVPWVLAGSVLPVLAYAARHDDERLRYVAARVFQGGLLAGGWFALVLILGAPFAIAVVGGATAHPAVSVLQILGIGIMPTFLVASGGFVLLALRRHRELVVANATALALAIGLSLALIPPFGAKGGAATTATLEIVLAILYQAILRRQRPDLRFPTDVLPRFALALAAGLALGGACLLVHSVVAVVVGSAVYFGVLLALRTIPPEIAEAIPRRR